MGDNRFKKIDDLNTTLENALNLCITTLKNLNLEGKTQDYVDKKCIKISEQINSKLDFIRNDSITNLHQCYTEAQKQIAQLGPIANANPADLGGCISLVKKIANLYVKPYQEALEYYIQLMPRIQSLTSNISAFASLPSYLPNIPNINFDKLEINMPPIGVDNIITGNLDTPQEPSEEKPRRQINFRTYEDMINQDKSLLKDGNNCFVTYNIVGINNKDGFRSLSDCILIITVRFNYNNGEFVFSPTQDSYESKKQFLQINKNKPSAYTATNDNTIRYCFIDGELMSIEKVYRKLVKNKLIIEDIDFARCSLEELTEKEFDPIYVEVS